MTRASLDLLQGTLDVLILKTLSWGPMHGYGVSRWIRQRTDDVLTVEDAALYQALHRLERRGWIESEWGQDAGYAVRQLAHAPAFTAATVLTLALGIGATSAIFSVVNGVLLKPLPFREPERLGRLFLR